MVKGAWWSHNNEQLDPLYVATELERRANRQRMYGSPQAALDMYNEALRIREEQLSGTEFNVLDELGKTYILTRNYDQAVECFRRAIDLIQKDYYAEHPRIAPILDDWTRCCLEQGELDKAAELCNRSLEIKQKSLLAQDVSTVETQRTLAEIYRRLEKYKEAETLLKQALKVVEPSTIGPVEEFLYEMALLYQDQGKLQEADGYFQKALPMFARRGGKIARYAMCLKSYASLLRELGRGKEAEHFDVDAAGMLENLEAEAVNFSGQNQPGPAWLQQDLYACTILH